MQRSTTVAVAGIWVGSGLGQPLDAINCTLGRGRVQPSVSRELSWCRRRLRKSRTPGQGQDPDYSDKCQWMGHGPSPYGAVVADIADHC
jgi:hypothetical protein